MIIEPPVALRFHEVNTAQVRDARAGICPHCPRPVEGNTNHSLAVKHTCDSIQFWQCSRCQVIVALGKP